MPNYQLQVDLSDGDVECLDQVMNGDNWKVYWCGTVWLVPTELVELPTEVLLGSSNPIALCEDPILSVGWEYRHSAVTLTNALASGEIIILPATLRVGGLLGSDSPKVDYYLAQFTQRNNTLRSAVRRLLPIVPAR